MARPASSSTAWPRAGARELDLPDARQYTSFWWAGEVQPFGWGFVLSPRQGRALRASLAAGKPVRVQASIRSRFYPGTFEVVEAFIPGTPGANEILLVSHLCHPRPGANDNASGAAALLETAATLARLIGQGDAPGAAPRHPLHLAAGDDRHLRLAGRAGGRGAQRALARRAQPGHGRRGSMPDQRRLRVCQPARGRRGLRRSPAELAAAAVQRRHPLQRSAFRQRLRSLHPHRSQRRHPDADDQRLAGQVLPHLGRHARQGEPGRPGAQRRAGRGSTRTGWRPPARPRPPGWAT